MPSWTTTARCSWCAADVGRRLGQHFLSDPSILRRIADAVRLSADDVVLEIGAGKGPLTRELMKRARRVVAIEADRRLASALADQLSGTNVRIVGGDALQVEWPVADKVCGNIPYQITSPLIERALRPPRPAAIVFLVQREVAERLAAAPGAKAYGALSAGVQLVARVERLFAVRAGSFNPPPRVESAVVRIVPKTEGAPSPREEADARVVIAALFQRRRQQLQRALRERWQLAAGRSLSILAEAGIDPTARPEQLSPEHFLVLARLLRAV